MELWGRLLIAVVVLAALIVSLKLLQRLGVVRASHVLPGEVQPLQVLARVNLSNTHALYLVKIFENLYVIGASPTNLRVVARVNEQNLPASALKGIKGQNQ